MPRLLKSETKQRLIVCQQALTIAFSMLATPRALGRAPSNTDGSIEIGLIGIAADLAIAACLYEVLGRSGIVRTDSGFYLTASEALDSFRKVLKSDDPRVSVLSVGIPNHTAHLKEIEESCANFSVIFTARAAAVHAGAGIAHDVAFVAGKSVGDFLCVLAKSTKWKPYLLNLPTTPELPKERHIIAQELAALIDKPECSKAGPLLSGIFLVLPELTQSEPTWLKTLQKVQVSPRSRDISILIKCLRDSQVGALFKVGQGANATPVKVVDNTNPNALPVHIEAMKKKFDKDLDCWSAYIGLANGELDKNILSLPDIDSVYRFSGLGIEKIVPAEDIANGLSAHSIWPFIATSLEYSGTTGPYFFLLNKLKVSELGQLLKQLNRAAKLSNKLAKKLQRHTKCITAAIDRGMSITSDDVTREFTTNIRSRNARRKALRASLKKRMTDNDQLLTKLTDENSLDWLLRSILEDRILLGEDKASTLRLLIDSANMREDTAALVEILKDRNQLALHTNARKAISDIDFLAFGPKLET